MAVSGQIKMRQSDASRNHRSTWRRSLAALCLGLASHGAHAEGLQVLHWWKSASERSAVNLIVAKLNEEDIVWRDGVIPSGSGVGAIIVLRSRILRQDAPEVALLNAVAIRDWAKLGLLVELDSVATAGKWEQRMLPAMVPLTQWNGHFVTAPVGIHRVNNLYTNRKLFKQFGLSAPTTWAEFERVAAKLKQKGVVPLAQSSEPWQVATLFETLIVAEGGAPFYRGLFLQGNDAAYASPKLAHALTRLRSLKQWMPNPIQEQPWTAPARAFANGEAAMFIMGDWAKGELTAWGLVTDEGFNCSAVPETGETHIYNIDSLAMLATGETHRAAQEKMAAILLSPGLQSDYNQVKGSVPVLRNPVLAKMDSCARASWTLFASSSAARVPSLVHRNAIDESIRDAVVAEVHRFFLDDSIAVADTQRRLAAIGRSIQKIDKQ